LNKYVGNKVGNALITRLAHWSKSSLAFLSLFVAASSAVAQDRPPAVPLVVYDPYFSIWSMSDKLTDSNTSLDRS